MMLKNVFALFMGLLLVTTVGCATNGRNLVLEEYSPNLPKGLANVEGMKVYVGDFSFTCDEARGKSKDAHNPANLLFRKLTSEETAKWDARHRELSANFKRQPDLVVGNLRNGFGMVLSNVYAMTPPEKWYRDSLLMELTHQGAIIVSNAADADVAITGRIVWLNIDIYMAYWSDLIVDVQLAASGSGSRTCTLHTTGGGTAWTTSSYEYLQPLREAQQRSIAILLTELASGRASKS